jgi:hypothetical protein
MNGPLGRARYCPRKEVYRTQMAGLRLCPGPAIHLSPGLQPWPLVAQGFDPTKSWCSTGRGWDHESSCKTSVLVLPVLQGAQGCLPLLCGLSSACGEPSSVTSDHLTFPINARILFVWHGITSTSGRDPSNRESWEGSGSSGCQGGSAWLTELAEDAVLVVAVAARDRGGWEPAPLATQMCRSLQGSQQDGLTRTL